ncbi:2Fe-2S ferredoxin [Aphanothece hegewaldii CCALA 016]|uniref:2Fe-2S ferredoxin n=1 Tax=Aphanothece hegewaldii CCALA 016 TaxID=2107694 RepID=A0A2T1M2P6_9CHRO|nr:(2Fe-2S) ferredoxin domain-containing protein [Aphanothece hegewaldii]PSF39028.1 2Fe-2S ferredoxin [Aphanothece hegewaldii CCALA 016]
MDLETNQRCVYVCQHSSCLRQGSAIILQEFKKADLPNNTTILPCECQGQCSSSPTVIVTPDTTWYYRVTPEDVTKIVEQHLKEGKPVKEKLHPRFHPRV